MSAFTHQAISRRSAANLFDAAHNIVQRLSPLQFTGLALTLTGVWLIQRR